MTFLGFCLKLFIKDELDRKIFELTIIQKIHNSIIYKFIYIKTTSILLAIYLLIYHKGDYGKIMKSINIRYSNAKVQNDNIKSTRLEIGKKNR